MVPNNSDPSDNPRWNSIGLPHLCTLYVSLCKCSRWLYILFISHVTKARYRCRILHFSCPPQQMIEVVKPADTPFPAPLEEGVTSAIYSEYIAPPPTLLQDTEETKVMYLLLYVGVNAVFLNSGPQDPLTGQDCEISEAHHRWYILLLSDCRIQSASPQGDP
uniref:Uncharacterized protein n=1 Tax=Leptobrachium leishanense TaxID=445787 RepID=A0A8C5M762_9ANUR